MPTCGPELSGWAAQIIEDLPETGNVTVGGVANWLRWNLPQLNARIFTDFVMSGECVSPDMSPAVSGIYSALYYCGYLAKQAAANLGVAGFAFVEVESHDQGRVRKAARTTIAAGYRAEAKACNEDLQILIDWYNSQGVGAPTVGQVLYWQRGANFSPLCEDSCYPIKYCGCHSVFSSYYLI